MVFPFPCAPASPPRYVSHLVLLITLHDDRTPTLCPCVSHRPSPASTESSCPAEGPLQWPYPYLVPLRPLQALLTCMYSVILSC